MTAEGDGRIVVFDYQRGCKTKMDPLLFDMLCKFQEGEVEDEEKIRVMQRVESLLVSPQKV